MNCRQLNFLLPLQSGPFCCTVLDQNVVWGLTTCEPSWPELFRWHPHQVAFRTWSVDSPLGRLRTNPTSPRRQFSPRALTLPVHFRCHPLALPFTDVRAESPLRTSWGGLGKLRKWALCLHLFSFWPVRSFFLSISLEALFFIVGTFVPGRWCGGVGGGPICTVPFSLMHRNNSTETWGIPHILFTAVPQFQQKVVDDPVPVTSPV